jgi:excisionase family DNA binding protein
MKKKESNMLTVREVAQRLGAAEISIRVWAKKGRLPGAKLQETPAGAYWLIPETALEGFEKGNPGRPHKPLAELKYKPRRKKQ